MFQDRGVIWPSDAEFGGGEMRASGRLAFGSPPEPPLRANYALASQATSVAPPTTSTTHVDRSSRSPSFIMSSIRIMRVP